MTSTALNLHLLTQDEFDERVETLMNEVMAEVMPKAPEPWKPLGFWKAMRQTLCGYSSSFVAYSIFTFFVVIMLFFAIVGVSLTYLLNPNHVYVGSFFFAISGLIFLVWPAQALEKMWKSRKNIPEIPPVAHLSRRVIRAKFVERMQSAIKEAENNLVGPASSVGKQVAEIEARRHKTDGLISRLEIMQNEDIENKEISGKIARARAKQTEYESALQRATELRDLGLSLLTQVKSRLPMEERYMELDIIEEELQELEGEKKVGETSIETVRQALSPIARDLVPLYAACEKVILLTEHTDDGAGSIDRFLKRADSAGENELAMRKLVSGTEIQTASV